VPTSDMDCAKKKSRKLFTENGLKRFLIKLHIDKVIMLENHIDLQHE
jgi:hypothetical protein